MSRNRHLPDADGVVGVAGEQSLAVGGPGQGQALGLIGLRRGRNDLGAQLLNGLLACQIPDLDRGSVGHAQPVAVGREAQGVDDVVVLQSVQVLAVIEVPQQGLGVLATWGAQGAIGRDGHRVQVAVVAVVVVLQLAVSQVPDLDGAIPAAGHDDRVGVVGREAHARHPVGVAILLDGELALSQGVPQLDGLVPRAGHDLTVIGREGNRQNVLESEQAFDD